MTTKDFNANARYRFINEIQAKNHTTALDPYYHRHTKTMQVWDVLTAMIVIGGLALGSTMFVKGCVLPEYKDRPKQLDCQGCHGLKVKMVEYFQKNKVVNPQAMAEAVMATKSPRLMAAINVGGEKKTPHTARNTGYRCAHSGSWQVNEKLHGKVSYDVTEQALQAEFVLTQHLKDEKTIVKAINAYGGESNKVKGKYAYNVLNELARTP